jgi:hypothetical protein
MVTFFVRQRVALVRCQARQCGYAACRTLLDVPRSKLTALDETAVDALFVDIGRALQ